MCFVLWQPRYHQLGVHVRTQELKEANSGMAQLQSRHRVLHASSDAMPCAASEALNKLAMVQVVSHSPQYYKE